MSFNAFMLPALPQLPVPGSKSPDGSGPAAFKSDQIVRPTDQNGSFATTLKQISARHHGSNRETTSAAKPPATSRPAQSPRSQKIGQTNTAAPDAGEKTALSRHLRQAFGERVYHLMNLLLADEGTLAVQSLSDPADGTHLFMPADWIGHLQLQEQQIQGEPVGIGPFEQLQLNISPEAMPRFFFEQLASRGSDPQDGGGQPVEAVRLFGFGQWMLTSAAWIAAGTLNGQIESPANDRNPLFNLLSHLAAMETPDSAMGFNPETGSSGGSNSAVGPQTVPFNADLLKMTVPSQTAEAGISEGARMAVADHGSPLSFWEPGDASSEASAEAQARQLKATTQSLKIQSDLQAAAQQSANPNSNAEAITAKTPEEVFGIKSAALKYEIAPDDAPGNKWVQIDGEGRDNGFLFSQDQLPPHLARLENATHSADAAQRSLMPQTLDQIVQKAVFSLNNGQHEVQIDLKPDFLGHIRMQVFSEGHQVAVKIVAELPFVKEMLENNLHQLKADLQAQGLDINELEVSVAHDSHGEADTRQTAEEAKVQAVRADIDLDDGLSENRDQSQSQGGDTMAEKAIDYFA